jgi:crotonobetainyl-CoA:carnitine CoA-transferase CaiB-like acyl-CoA transferase
MNITGPVDGPPAKVGVAVTDVITGLYAAIAVLACLRARQESGHGYAIDLALLDCALAAQVNVAQAFLTSGTVPPRQGNAHLQIVPYQLFATQDGWLVLAVGNDRQWQHFCQSAQRPDLAADARYGTNALRVTNRAVLTPLLEIVLKQHPTRQWQDRLLKAEVPHAPVWDYAELFGQPQGEARGWRLKVRDPQGKPVDLVGSPFQIGGMNMPQATLPPQIGEHTESVLKDLLGLDSEKIKELRRGGII